MGESAHPCTVLSRERREYLFRHSALSPFRLAEVTPIYINALLAELLPPAARLLERATSLCQGDLDPYRTDPGFPGRYLRLVTESLHHDVASPRWDEIETALSRVGIASDCTKERFASPLAGRRPRFYLEVERFYEGGNGGSGRHARLGHIEFKGVGRNVMAVRSDFWHSWGGVDYETLCAEILLSEQISAISPLGSVPIIGASLYTRDASLVAMRHDPARGNDPGGGHVASSKYLLVGTICRAVNYTRLADVYLKSDFAKMDLKGIPSLDALLRQYASLAAFGYGYFQASMDNVTLEGNSLDCQMSLVSSTDYGPVLYEQSVPSGPQSRVLQSALHGMTSENGPLANCHAGAAAHLAVKRADALRCKLGLHSLAAGWEEEMARVTAFYWLLANGFGLEFSNATAESLAPLFRHYLQPWDRDMEEYVKATQFALLRIEQKEGGLVVRFGEHRPEEYAKLNAFVSAHAAEQSSLIDVYNRRQRARASELKRLIRKGLTLLLSSPEAAEVARRHRRFMNQAIIATRQYSPLSAERDRCEVIGEWHSQRSTLRSRIIDKASIWFGRDIRGWRVVCSMLIEGRPVRETVSAQASDGELIFEPVWKGRGRKELLAEGVELLLTKRRRLLLPLPVTYLQQGR